MLNSVWNTSSLNAVFLVILKTLQLETVKIVSIENYQSRTVYYYDSSFTGKRIKLVVYLPN